MILLFLGGAYKMAEAKREQESMPNALLEEARSIISKKDMDKEGYIKDAMSFYIKEKKRIEIIEELKRGYQEMGKINLEIAETGLTEDLNNLFAYEKYVGEIV